MPRPELFLADPLCSPGRLSLGPFPAALAAEERSCARNFRRRLSGARLQDALHLHGTREATLGEEVATPRSQVSAASELEQRNMECRMI